MSPPNLSTRFNSQYPWSQYPWHPDTYEHDVRVQRGRLPDRVSGPSGLPNNLDFPRASQK